MSNRKPIETAKAPQAIGPYSQAILCDGWLYSSGQVAIDPQSGQMVGGGVELEARQCFANLAAVLESAKCSFTDVVKVTVYLQDLSDFATVNGVYAEFFAEPYPARACVEVARLPKDALVELDCVARVPQSS
ncbi:MAG: 2-iminobutanoate/2-iminopropanoate deaminase [Planctomycetota bacterium]